MSSVPPMILVVHDHTLQYYFICNGRAFTIVPPFTNLGPPEINPLTFNIDSEWHGCFSIIYGIKYFTSYNYDLNK